MEKAFDTVKLEQAANTATTLAKIDELLEALREYGTSTETAMDADNDHQPALQRLNERVQQAAALDAVGTAHKEYERSSSESLQRACDQRLLQVPCFAVPIHQGDRAAAGAARHCACSAAGSARRWVSEIDLLTRPL